MAGESNVRIPKRGEHVSAVQLQGIFEVLAVNALMQTANIRLVDGTGSVIPNVPWTDLKVVDKK